MPDGGDQTGIASDQGAFSFLAGVEREKLRRTIQGREFRVASAFARSRRTPEDWTGPFVVGLHREVFAAFFPSAAGRFRRDEILFGRRAGANPEHIGSLVEQLVAAIRDHLAAVHAIDDGERRLNEAFMFAARDHAEMIRIHPFIDGNGRWARIATVLFLRDCGYAEGTFVAKRDRARYIAAADRCTDDGEPGDLANLLLEGYIELMKTRNG